MSKELLQQALDALLGYKPHSLTHAKEQGSVIIALRAAITQPVQEPVYQYQLANGNWIDQAKESYDYNVKLGQAVVRVLYATPVAQPVQPAVPLQVGQEPIYQVFANYRSIDDGWKDATERAYWCFSEGMRRIVYTALLAQPVGPAVLSLPTLSTPPVQSGNEPVAYARSDTVFGWRGQLMNAAMMFPSPAGLKNPIGLYAAPVAQSEPLSDSAIEAGASAMVDSCISKGHWKHATDESKAVYRQHARAVLETIKPPIGAQE